MLRLTLKQFPAAALTSLLLLGGCSTPPAPNAGPLVDLILVAGQSNAVGFDAVPAELPHDAADEKILFWWRCGDPPSDEHDSTSGGEWNFLQPQPQGHPIKTEKPYITRQYGNFAQPAGGFGPEMGLARTLQRKEKRRLAVVKVAFSGTAMRADWNPADAEDGGACYRSLVRETRSAISAAERSGLRLKVRALVWVQGESDANAQDAPRYADGLSAMLAALRRDLHAPEMFALLALNTRNSAGRNPFIPRIIKAQKVVAGRDHRAAYVDTTAAAIANDAHWNSTGTLDAGRWFAEALWKLEAGVGSTNQRAHH